MTPDQLFRDPQVEYLTVCFHQDGKNVRHKINIMFGGTEIRAQNALQLGELIQLRVEKAKHELATVAQKAIP